MHTTAPHMRCEPRRTQCVDMHMCQWYAFRVCVCVHNLTALTRYQTEHLLTIVNMKCCNLLCRNLLCVFIPRDKSICNRSKTRTEPRASLMPGKYYASDAATAFVAHENAPSARSRTHMRTRNNNNTQLVVCVCVDMLDVRWWLGWRLLVVAWRWFGVDWFRFINSDWGFTVRTAHTHNTHTDARQTASTSWTIKCGARNIRMSFMYSTAWQYSWCDKDS